MSKDYSILLENLLERRFDETLQSPIVSDAFNNLDYPESIKYTLESMQEIDPSYTQKTFHLAERVQEKIGREFRKRKIPVDFRYQGSIQTETHILLHGGIELLVLPYLNPKSSPWKGVTQTADELLEVLPGENIEDVNFNSKHKIRLIMSSPTCELTVIPAVWMNNGKFKETKREIDRAICEYNLEKKTRRKYLPFLNIARINSKDDRTNGGLKRSARLLRSLQRDAKDPIGLNNYEICSILYAISDKDLHYEGEKGLSLLSTVASQLKKVASDKKFREQLISPSEKELVFGKSKGKLTEIQKLQKELEELIADLKRDLTSTGLKLDGKIPYH